jgi:hypothetical protein
LEGHSAEAKPPTHLEAPLRPNRGDEGQQTRNGKVRILQAYSSVIALQGNDVMHR